MQVHARTGAPDDPPPHLPCDEEQIRAEVFRHSRRELAAKWGVHEKTVARWRARFRPPEPSPLRGDDMVDFCKALDYLLGLHGLSPVEAIPHLEKAGYRIYRLP